MPASMTKSPMSTPQEQLGTVKESRPTTNACTPCRKVKMKCNTGASASEPCLRCQRKHFNCVHEVHRRGRKPGSKVTVRDGESGTRPVPHLATVNCQGQTGENVPVGSLVSSNVGEKADAFSPFRLLNKHTMAGTFCVQNVLEAARTSATDNTTHTESVNSIFVDELQDPIAIGLINLPTAMQLFDSFLKYLSPYIIHFDPVLHTFKYIQLASPFFLVTILSASSRIFNPDLYNKLYRYSEELLARSFISGEKSIEIIQAVLMKTYWKEPDDSRVWQLVGYASRMYAELCGGKSRTLKHMDPSSATSELELRKQRNLERTWLTLFVYDRSISLQVGKPWMLHEDDLVRTVDAWYSHEFKMPQSDAILAAFVQLRVIGSEMVDILDINLSTKNQELQEMSLNLLDTELEKWESRWCKIFQTVILEPCHLFLFKFYGLHFKLYINSLRLQGGLISSGIIAKHALWLSYSSAIKMMEAIIEILGPAQLLYFAQDSIHMMTAYAAVFLIKLLLLLPEALPASAELTIIDLLSTTSRIFSEQCVTAKTSCAYQARFLRNLVTQYWTSKTSTAEVSDQNDGILPLGSQAQYCSTGSQARGAAQAEYSSSSNANWKSSNIDPGVNVMPKHGTDTLYPAPEAEYGVLGEAPQASSVLRNLKSPKLGDFSSWHPHLFEPDIWEGLFIDAGFNINEDTLMPSLSGVL